MRVRTIALAWGSVSFILLVMVTGMGLGLKSKDRAGLFNSANKD